jgi:two-component system OmpR family sensor kinase
MSLRSRLLLTTIAVIAVALGIAGVTTYLTFRAAMLADIDQSLREVALPLRERDVAEVRAPMPGVTPFVQVRSADGAVIRSVPARLPDGQQVAPELPVVISPAGVSDSADGPATFSTATGEGATFRVKASVNSAGEQLIIALPIDADLATLRQLAVIEVAVAVAALLVASVLGFVSVRVGLRPLTRLTAQTRALGPAGSPTRVLIEEPRTEVGELGTAINEMLDETSAAMAQRTAAEARLRRFVADASHELRTPIAAVSAYAELFELGAKVRPDDLQRAMTGIVRETGRMRSLAADLLALARLDDHRDIAPQRVDLSALARDAVDAAAAVDPSRPIEFRAADGADVQGDATSLRQLLDNLLGNVRAHTPPGTATEVTVALEGSLVVLTVDDAGPGVAEENLAAMFERFWREDTARSRSAGGSGLGLAIVSAIVAGHHGSISAARSRLGGLRVTVSIPPAGAGHPTE